MSFRISSLKQYSFLLTLAQFLPLESSCHVVRMVTTHEHAARDVLPPVSAKVLAIGKHPLPWVQILENSLQMILAPRL